MHTPARCESDRHFLASGLKINSCSLVRICHDVEVVVDMVKMIRMGAGALAFAALDAFGNEAMEYVQDEQVRVSKATPILGRRLASFVDSWQT